MALLEARLRMKVGNDVNAVLTYEILQNNFLSKKKRMQVGIPSFNLLENEYLSVELPTVFHGVYCRGQSTSLIVLIGETGLLEESEGESGQKPPVFQCWVRSAPPAA